ncbi:TPR_REGION domain-containing protein [Meloidogyne graminicola]|uniref:TPR_REGION domain-containing protein n=1 Tax=Meloidogyne graminicola TaxID=189291 RepID=A0A8S9ZW10_9BILA|nr:TPR_REGION domain-containing protein [Meloidogyne graminicola]
MFKHIFSSYSKFAFGNSKAGIGLFSAAAVAVSIPGNVVQSWSDSELKKKPSWYQETVHKLEHVVRKLSLYSYIEDPSLLDDASDILQRVENVNNCEIFWRLGRVFVEQANLLPNKAIEERKELLEKAIIRLNKALQLETSQGLAGAHKWYAIALIRLKQVDKDNKHLKNADKEIIKHLETAVKLDSKDAFSYHFLGVQYFYVGNNEAALKNLKKAEDLKPGYSANQTYLGMALAMNNKKEEAIAIMKKALQGNSKNRADRKAKVIARAFLQNKLGQTTKDLQFVEEY